MNWSLEKHDEVVVMQMRSNPVNKMNPAFFADLQNAFDTLDAEFPDLPVVLTGQGSSFSAGLDFEDAFPRFARGDMEEVAEWFATFRAAILRVLTCPRRVVGAINGHTFAGGLILAVCCDWRVGHRGKFALNEVPIGIPMPATYTELLRASVGQRVTADAVLSGRIYEAPEALTAGFLHALVPEDQVLSTAIAEAARIQPACAEAYAISKQILQAPLLERLATVEAADRRTMRVVTGPGSTRAQTLALARLKGRA
jgi:enoyl-CoA hydratase